MNQNIFTYGSLMFPQVWERVVRGRYRSGQAVARNHERLKVTGETYPGMIAAAGKSVHGMLYFDVTPQDIAALDAFEGDDYRREMIDVTLDSGQVITAGAYICLVPARLADEQWRPEAFQMERFLSTYVRARLGE